MAVSEATEVSDEALTEARTRLTNAMRSAVEQTRRVNPALADVMERDIFHIHASVFQWRLS